MMEQIVSNGVPIFFFFVGTMLALGTSMVIEKLKKSESPDDDDDS